MTMLVCRVELYDKSNKNEKMYKSHITSLKVIMRSFIFSHKIAWIFCDFMNKL